MATRRWGLSRGETEQNVTEAVGAATAADNVELTVDLAANMTKHEVLVALDQIKNAVVKANWPPA